MNLNLYFILKVQADFCAFFNKHGNIFKQNWPSIAEKIIKFAKQKKADKDVRAILKDYNDKTKGL